MQSHISRYVIFINQSNFKHLTLNMKYKIKTMMCEAIV